jgi:uncharacterized membrane protein
MIDNWVIFLIGYIFVAVVMILHFSYNHCFDGGYTEVTLISFIKGLFFPITLIVSIISIILILIRINKEIKEDELGEGK